VKRAHTQHLVQIFVESFGLVRGGEGIKPGIGLTKLKICTSPAARSHGAASRSRLAISSPNPPHAAPNASPAGASPRAREQRPSLSSPPRRGPLRPLKEQVGGMHLPIRSDRRRGSNGGHHSSLRRPVGRRMQAALAGCRSGRRW
jgi:hypothetical protein